MKAAPRSRPALRIEAVLLLPLTVCCALLCAMGGDGTLLSVLRGKTPKGRTP